MTEAARVHEAEERLQTILKAVVVGARAGDPTSRPGGEDLTEAFAASGPADKFFLRVFSEFRREDWNHEAAFE